jgi:aminomethyltransferase
MHQRVDVVVPEAFPAFEDFWPVRVDGAEVGRLTSAGHSPRLDANLGYAWVPIAQAEAGNELEIESPEGPMTATVTPIPFLDPKKAIPATS